MAGSQRVVAFLRGVAPMYAKNDDLRAAYEAAGFLGVRTVLSSGNVVFDTDRPADAHLEADLERAVHDHLGRRFPTLVRPQAALVDLLAEDPFAGHELPADAKRVVTFLRTPLEDADLPMTRDGATVLATRGREAFTAYVPQPRGGLFMRLVEDVCGEDQTTRTMQTVEKVAKA